MYVKLAVCVSMTNVRGVCQNFGDVEICYVYEKGI